MIRFELLRSTRVPRGLCSKEDLRALAESVLRAESVPFPAELTLDLVAPERIRDLNRRFRGVDRVTDVISFRNDLESSPTPSNARRPGADGLQGDIAINVPQAVFQARQEGHSPARELRLLWIHGLLHLLGYSDDEPEPRRRMFKRQNELLRRWERRAGRC